MSNIKQIDPVFVGIFLKRSLRRWGSSLEQKQQKSIQRAIEACGKLSLNKSLSLNEKMIQEIEVAFNSLSGKKL